MMGLWSANGLYSALVEHLGHPPKYFPKKVFSESDDLIRAIMIAYNLEIMRSVRRVGDIFGGMTFSGVRNECLRVGFNIDQLIEDDIRSNMPHRELKELHMIGTARIIAIEKKLGLSRSPRNALKKYSDKFIEQVFCENERNATKTAELLGIHRTTVSGALKRKEKVRKACD